MTKRIGFILFQNDTEPDSVNLVLEVRKISYLEYGKWWINVIKPASTHVPVPHLSRQQTWLLPQSLLPEHSPGMGTGPHSWPGSIGAHSFGRVSRKFEGRLMMVKDSDKI